MRRITSLLTIAALLSVSSLPMLPQTPVCYAAEAAGLSAGYEEHAHLIHGKSGMEMHHNGDQHQTMQHEKNSHHHGNMNHHKGSDDHQMHQQSDPLHKNRVALSAAEKECRIECGGGCHRSIDGFPQVLSPHLIQTINFETGEQIVRINPGLFPALASLIEAIPPPPPKHS